MKTRRHIKTREELMGELRDVTGAHIDYDIEGSVHIDGWIAKSELSRVGWLLIALSRRET